MEMGGNTVVVTTKGGFFEHQKSFSSLAAFVRGDTKENPTFSIEMIIEDLESLATCSNKSCCPP